MLRSGRWTGALLASAAALLVLAAACGGDDDDGNGDPTATPAVRFEPQPAVPQDIEDEVTEAVNGVVETVAGDNFFTGNNIKAPLGEATTINVTNEGGALHNLRIAGADGVWNTADDVVTEPEFIPAGESGTLVFTPAVPGAYTFKCDLHPTEQGGVIVVEES